MAAVNMPNVEGLNTVAELKNAIAKMTKELSWLLENIDWRNINQLHIALNGGASVTIENDGITVNDGTMDTFKVNTDGKVTMTGATVQSANGYPKVVIDPDNQLFGAYTSETEAVTIGPYKSGVSTSPYVRWESAGKGHQMNILGNQLLMSGFLEVAIAAGLGRNVVIQGDRIKLYPEQTVDVDSWSKIRNTSTGQTLDQFATKGVYTESSQSYNCGIPIGTQFKDVNGMTWTWGGVPEHSHKQV